MCWGPCDSVGRMVCARLAARPVRPHRVPADHATSEVLVRALHARVDDVHAHAAARQVAIIVDAVDRAACVPGASDEGKRPAAGRTTRCRRHKLC